jgi:hypothetical protein
MSIAILVIAAMMQTDGAAPALRREIERGPVKVVLEVTPAEVRLSDQPELRISAAHDPAVEVTLPVFAGELGGFAVVSSRKPNPTAQDGRTVTSIEVELEPLASGTLTLPAFTISCVDRRAATLVEHREGLAFEVTTEPLPIEVKSLIAGDAPSLDQLKGSLPPLAVEVTRTPPWNWIIGGACAVIALALLAALLRRRRVEAVAAAPPPTAQELARREFVALVESDAYAKGDLATFYSELTLIVRRYIERTKGVAAPEQTTEEFLREMRQHPAFDATARDRLRAFLESADLVKFAGVRPDESDVEESFRRGQEFTEQSEPIALRQSRGRVA